MGKTLLCSVNNASFIAIIILLVINKPTYILKIMS